MLHVATFEQCNSLSATLDEKRWQGQLWSQPNCGIPPVILRVYYTTRQLPYLKPRIETEGVQAAEVSQDMAICQVDRFRKTFIQVGLDAGSEAASCRAPLFR